MPKNPLPLDHPVLVVEDDGIVRMVAVDMLEEAGFTVLEAETADAAWNILEETSGVCALFTDIDMPGSMDGLTLADRVAERWPHIRLIVTSGRRSFQDQDMPDDGRFLIKPYLSSELVRAIVQAS